MTNKEHIIGCIGEECLEVLREIRKGGVNFQDTQSFRKEFIDLIAVIKMMKDESIVYFDLIDFKELDKLKNTYNEDTGLIELLEDLQYYCYKANRFGLDNRKPNNELNNEDMIISLSKQIISFAHFTLNCVKGYEKEIQDKIDKVNSFKALAYKNSVLFNNDEVFLSGLYNREAIASEPTHYTIFEKDCPICGGLDKDCEHKYNLEKLENQAKYFKQGITNKLKNLKKYQHTLRECYIPFTDEIKEKFSEQNIKIDYKNTEYEKEIKDGLFRSSLKVSKYKDKALIYEDEHFFLYNKNEKGTRINWQIGLTLEEYKNHSLKQEAKFLEDNKIEFAYYILDDDYVFKATTKESVLGRVNLNIYELDKRLEIKNPNIETFDIDEDLTKNGVYDD